MAFSSTHIRLTRTSSDLRILSHLLPPSPILEADGFSTSSTSGEIPILLEVTTHVCDSALYAPGLSNVAKGSKPIDTARHTNDVTYKDEPFLKDRMCEESTGMRTTPELPSSRYRDATPHSGPDSPSKVLSSHPKTGKQSVYNDLYGADVRRSGMLGDFSASLAMLGKQGRYQGSRDSRWQASFRPNSMGLSSTTVAPEADLDGNQLVMFATFHTYSTLPTPTFAPPSPSPSVDVISPLPSPVGRQRHRRPLERARAVRFPGRPKSPRLQASEIEAKPVHNAPSPANHASNPLRQLTDSMPTVSTQSCTTNAIHPSTKSVALPEELSWLKHMTIELWIDQEGFRAVKPCMQLVGYSPRNRSLHPYESVENTMSDVTAGVAEFMPTKREIFAFHYATLDSPPILRMVSIAGDESHDYICRQATLSVKVNAVYTVLGTETLVASTVNSDVHGSRLQNVRLRWKFDYLVSDRKVDGNGKTLPGEKTLTPLTFSCSPYLFHQSQGKKTGLMHIMRKNLAPKLASQKLEPPTYASSRGILAQVPCYLSPGRDAALHARSRSDVSGESGGYPFAKSLLDTGVKGGTMQSVNYVPRARRRRASSAGEGSLDSNVRVRLKGELLTPVSGNRLPLVIQ